MSIHYQGGGVTLHHGDCLDVLRTLPDASVDSVVTDPPYNLGFMGKGWDTFGGRAMSDETRDRQLASGAGWTKKPYGASGKAAAPAPGEAAAFQQWCELWAAECLRVLKPGGHLLAFGGTRTWHRLACAVEDAGFEVRDSLAWLYGSGFPKSHDVSKHIDRMAGAERPRTKIQGTGKGANAWKVEQGGQANHWIADAKARGEKTVLVANDEPITDAAREWEGWGTALKPAFEPVVVARKPLIGTVAANVTTHGTGALNIDASRIGTDEIVSRGGISPGAHNLVGGPNLQREPTTSIGRWPANVILDEDMAGVLDEQSGNRPSGRINFGDDRERTTLNPARDGSTITAGRGYDDMGGASRFFYVAKAPKRERPVVDGVAHPTVKPLALMRWLVRLVTPPGGTVLEPFAGSGTTVEACIVEGFHCIAIEKGDEYLPLILERIRRQVELPEVAEMVRTVDPVAAILEQVDGQLDIFGEETA